MVAGRAAPRLAGRSAPPTSTMRKTRRLPTALLLVLGGTAGAWAASPPSVEKCARELGTLAVAEPQSHTLSGLSRYGLGSPSTMLRMMAQESGCFAVVERGVAMQNLQQERALAAGGQLQEGSNVGAGQLQAADFVMTPTVQFAAETGGAGAVVGGLLSHTKLAPLSGIAGGVKFKEAETTLLVADVRSGVQVASAEGKASKMDFAVGGWGWAGIGWAAGGGYTKTPEGKLIAASLLDNFNKIVTTIRDKPSLIRPTVQASRDNAANSIQATNQRPATGAAAATATPGAALPAGFSGAFSGQYTGGEQGNFAIVVGPNGQVTGFGQSPSAGNLQLSGSINASGAISMGAANQGGAPAARFVGFVNAQTGDVIGTWQSANGSLQGTFSGKRQ